MSKRKDGITLISLMITIIIMLILAGVAISLAIKDNGIFQKSEIAKENYKNAAQQEQADLEELYSSILVATGEDAKITISMEDLNHLITTKVQEEMEKNNINNRLEAIEKNSNVKIKTGKIHYSSIPANGGIKSYSVTFDTPFETLDYVVSLQHGEANVWGFI